MHHKSFCTDLLLALTIFSTPFCKAQDTARVTSSFIGSHGYLLESGNKKVALDALIYWEDANWGYIKPPIELANRMRKASYPFNSLDLILIGHAHSDHYNTEIVERAMLKNDSAVLVTTPDVIADIQAHVDSFSFYSDRVWVPDLEFYESADSVINNIPLTITSIPHGNEGMELYVPAFELDSIRFMQLNGWNNLTALAYDTLGFNKKRADVSFLCYTYVLDLAKNKLFREHINPVFSTISHIDGANNSRIDQIQDSILSQRADYPMNLLYIPMEQLTFSKVNGHLWVDTLNRAPIVTMNLLSQEVFVDEEFSVTIPENLFEDPEGSPVDINATPSTGGVLPSWLNFNEETGVLEGTPVESGNITITINGADSLLAISKCPISIIVRNPESIKQDKENTFSVFPNPSNGLFRLEFNGKEADYRVFNLCGQVLQQGKIENQEFLNLVHLGKGMFFFHFEYNNQLACFPLVIQ